MRRDSCDEVHMVLTEGEDIHMLCANQFASPVRQLRPVSFPRSKDVRSQTLVSRNSSKNSSFALDA